MKKRKNKPKKIGLRWDNIFLYIIFPLLLVIFMCFIFIFSKNKIHSYLKEKEEQKKVLELEMLISESIKESEYHEKYLEESSKQYEIDKKKKEMEEEANQRKIQIEFENKIFSKYWPHGTYVRNEQTGEHGIVDYCQIPNVYTQEGWYFETYPENGKEGFFNKDITKVGWNDWYNWTQNNFKKKSKEYQNKINDIILNEKNKREQQAKKLYPPNPKYAHVKYNNEYYFIINWDNGVLTLRSMNDNYKTSNLIKLQYDDPKISKINSKQEIIDFYMRK